MSLQRRLTLTDFIRVCHFGKNVFDAETGATQMRKLSFGVALLLSTGDGDLHEDAIGLWLNGRAIQSAKLIVHKAVQREDSADVHGTHDMSPVKITLASWLPRVRKSGLPCLAYSALLRRLVTPS